MERCFVSQASEEATGSLTVKRQTLQLYPKTCLSPHYPGAQSAATGQPVSRSCLTPAYDGFGPQPFDSE